MYRILLDGTDIYGNNSEMSVLGPRLDVELNSAGSLEFTLPVDNVSWATPNVFTNEVEVIEDGDVIFFGRPLQITRDWNNQKKVVCEGALAYFNDTIQRTHEIKISDHITLEEFFRFLIGMHNSQVDEQEGSGISHKHFEVGVVDIENKGKYVYRKTDYQTTFECLQQMCLDTDGGYFILRKEYDEYGNATRYIDWVGEMPYGSDQPVQFGVNLLDLSQDLNGADICTVLIPTGGDNINLSGYNTISPSNPEYKGVGHIGPSDEIYYKPAMDLYGRVIQQKSWSDYTDQGALWRKAAEWLKHKNEYIPTIEVSAADLHYIDKYKDHGIPMYSIFKIGMAVQVISAPHGLTGNLPSEDEDAPTLIIHKLSLDLDSATKKITIGTPPKKELTDILAPSAGGSSTRGSGNKGDGPITVIEQKLVRLQSVNVKYPGETEYSNVVSNKNAYIDLSEISGNVEDVRTSNGTSVVNPNKIAILPDAPVQDVRVDNVSVVGAGIANLDSSSFGDKVEANPVEQASANMTKIGINGNVYAVHGNGDVADVTLKTSQVRMYRIRTIDNVFSTATLMVETYFDSELVLQEEYTKTEATTPINIDGYLELKFLESQWSYCLLKDSTTHEEGYTETWGYNITKDYHETFMSDFESVVDSNHVAKIDFSSLHMFGLFENKIKHDTSSPPVRFGSVTDVFIEELNDKSRTYITLIDETQVPDNLGTGLNYRTEDVSGTRPEVGYWYEGVYYIDPEVGYSYLYNGGSGGSGSLVTPHEPADGRGSRMDGEWSNSDIVRSYTGIPYVYTSASSSGPMAIFTKQFNTKIKPTKLSGTLFFTYRYGGGGVGVVNPNPVEQQAMAAVIDIYVSNDGTNWTLIYRGANNAELLLPLDLNIDIDLNCDGFYSYVKLQLSSGSVIYHGDYPLGYQNFELKGIEEGNEIKHIWYKTSEKDWIKQSVVSEYEFTTAIDTLQTNFQAGVDSVYDACVSKGSTPASHSLTDVVNGILNIPQSGGGGGVSITSSAYEINLPIRYATSNINVAASITTTAGGT